MERLRILLSHHAIRLMILLFVFGIFQLLSAGIWWLFPLPLLGVLVQMLNEYSLHRFIFHLPPPKQQWAFDLLYQAHYGHHDFPTNKSLVFVPYWVALPILCLNFIMAYGLVYFIAPAHAFMGATAIVLVGGVATFLTYEWLHLTAHMNVPKKWPERRVTTLHSQHHFRDFSKCFHVTLGGEIIDKAMGTAINQETLKDLQRIEFIRTLGMHPDDARLVTARQRFAQKYHLSAIDIERAAKS